MQHFLQPCFLRNMLRMLAYRFFFVFLNLPVEEEVSIKAKYSAYYLNNVSKPGKVFQKQRCATATQLMQRWVFLPFILETPVACLRNKHLSTAKVEAMRGRQEV